MQKECVISRKGTVIARSSGTVLHKEIELIAPKVSDIEFESATLFTELKTSSNTHAKVEAGLDKDLGETCHELKKRTRESDALREREGSASTVKGLRLCVMLSKGMN